jgi:MFS family permease
MKVFGILFLGVGMALAEEASDSSLAQRALNDFLSEKQTRSSGWYFGTVTAGFGAGALVLGSHFDGIAATHRNKAALAWEAGDQAAAYKTSRNEMVKWKDRRDVAWIAGVALGAVGGGLMAYDFFIDRRRTSVTVVPNGVQVTRSF